MNLILHIQSALTRRSCPRMQIPARWQFRIWVKAALVFIQRQAGAAKKAMPSIAATLPHTGPIELTIRLVDEVESEELNTTYRHKTNPTNVLSFPFTELDETGALYLGDLAICPSVLFHEAKAQQKPLMAHWAHLTIHGVLHLWGYDHILVAEAEQMEELEVAILKKMGISNPYETKKSNLTASLSHFVGDG